MFNFNEAMYFINGFTKRGKPVKDLNRIAALLEMLGNPQNSLKFIHIAGTNGKGSVAQMCCETLIKSGYKTGLFTSPFMVEYSDRIRINDIMIPGEKLAECTYKVHETVKGLEYKDNFSQFEITTAIAFIYFESEKCDVVVLETGIGGKLDCTNIILPPLVSVVTSVSFDHVKMLGYTLEEIANHKAGIIKKGSPSVLSINNPDKVVKVVKKNAQLQGSVLTIPDVSSLKVLESDILDNRFVYKDVEYTTKMSGYHQIINALTAIEAMNIVKANLPQIKQSDIVYGISKAMVIARTEVVSTKPVIMIDGCHNPDGMKALANVVEKVKSRRKIFIVGMIKDKNLKNSLSNITPLADEIICVDGFYPTCVYATELERIVKSLGIDNVSAMNIKDSVKNVREKLQDDDMLIVCGSLYLASKIRGYFIY